MLSLRFVFVFITVLSFGQEKPRLKTVPVAEALTFWSVSAVDESVAWVSANKGTVGRTTDRGQHWTFQKVKGFEEKEFRSIYAFDARVAVVANVGSPAFILRTTDGGDKWEEVYRNDSPEAFIDGIDFWDGSEGLAYGDPINSRMLLLRTSDSGKTWQELSETSRPILEKGQASFASSGTGIRCYGKGEAVIATGGTISQLFVSTDKGNTWKPEAPLLRQGSSTGGIFSVAIGSSGGRLLVGGDFQDSLATELAAYQHTSGEWKTPVRLPGGTRWCVEYVTASMAVAVGPSGGDITFDGGKTWEPLFADKSYHVARRSRKGEWFVVAGAKSKLAILE
jgi:photosystem II stability/assembly factor-like uncharacterized protein